MKEDEAYLEVATRYLESCERHIAENIDIQEVIGFMGYHAFESLAGAYNAHYGYNVPRSHVRKLNAFVANARHDNRVNGRAIAIVAMLVNSIRSKCLYPEDSGNGAYVAPSDRISMTSAKEVVRRVRGVIRRVESSF